MTGRFTDLVMDDETDRLFRKDSGLCEKCTKPFEDKSYKHKRCADCRIVQTNSENPKYDAYTEIMTKPSTKYPKWSYGFFLLDPYGDINYEHEDNDF